MFGVPLPVGKRGTFGVFCTGSDRPWIGTKKVPFFIALKSKGQQNGN
jgi:hypothetical protein